MKIYVLHYSKLIDRKKHIVNQFNKNNITDFEFIELFDKDKLSNTEIQNFDNKLKLTEISLSLKHYYVYKLIADNYDQALIFEDDIILSDNFINKLGKCLNQLPNDYDMLFIGDGCGLHIKKGKINSDMVIYEKCLYPTTWGGDGCSRASDSYLISKKCAIKLCDFIINNKTTKPIDWWINNVARHYNFKVYWAEPTIVTQGSQNGLYNSSIQ